MSGDNATSIQRFREHESSGKSQMTLYKSLKFELENDPKIKQDVAMFRRVGFYSLRGRLGSGNFSKVKYGIHLLTNECCAVKIIDKSCLDEKAQRLLSGEVTCMEKLNHPNIIRLFEIIETFSTLYLVMECANKGSLQSRVKINGPYSEAESRVIFLQIAAAINHMHENNIVHRDIKADNIFFLTNATVKVGDFGFSTQSSHLDYLDSACGSPPYAAPELFTGTRYIGQRADIWALGVTLFFMLAGRLPFRGQNLAELRDSVISGIYSLPEGCSSDSGELIGGLLQADVDKRFTMKAIFSSDWLGSKSGAKMVKKKSESPEASFSFSLTSEGRQAKSFLSLESTTSNREIVQKLEVMGLPDLDGADFSLEPRTPTLGAYRILMHRRQETLMMAREDCESAAEKTSVTAGCGLKSRTRTFTYRRKRVTQKNSRFCTVS